MGMAGAIVAYFYPSLRWKISLYFLIAVCGLSLYQKEFNDYHAFYHFTNNYPVDMIGTIEDIDHGFIAGKQATIITLYVHRIKNETFTQKINKNLLVYASQVQDMHVGDTIQLHNVTCKKPENEHLSMYQIREQMCAAVFISKPYYTILDRPTISFKRWIYQTKQTILKNSEQKLSSHTFLFFSSLFLVNRLYVKKKLEDINEQFKQWGIFHFLARSGLHLALFIIMWQAILRYIPVPFTTKTILLIVLSIIYALFSWSSTPFTRSFLLFLCNKSCLLAHTSYNLLHYLTLICFCFLLYCPMYLFFLDFQLTFGITFTLAWFNVLCNQYTNEQSIPQQVKY